MHRGRGNMSQNTGDEGSGRGVTDCRLLLHLSRGNTGAIIFHLGCHILSWLYLHHIISNSHHIISNSHDKIFQSKGEGKGRPSHILGCKASTKPMSLSRRKCSDILLDNSLSCLMQLYSSHMSCSSKTISPLYCVPPNDHAT